MQKIKGDHKTITTDRQILGLAAELARLDDMSVSQLQERFSELFGFPARSNHKSYLRKRLAFRIQELSIRSFSEKARLRIEELAAESFPAAPRKPKNPPGKKGRPRDVRLPPPGSVLHRSYKGKVHEVKVLTDGLEYEGKHYRTLSKVAREITGVQWNGYTFFGLKESGVRRLETGVRRLESGD